MRIRCSYDKLVSLGELKPHPKNRNIHPAGQISRLADILKYLGVRKPIVVSKLSGWVTSGHGRLEAAKLLGMKKYPVNFQDYDDSNQEYADLTADNTIALWAEIDMAGITSDVADLGPDFNVDLLGIEGFSIDTTDSKKSLTDEDHVPVPRSKLKTVSGDLYLLGKHRLLCGDATDRSSVKRLLKGESVKMVFTDPPYGMKVVKKDGNNNGLGEAIDGVVGVAAKGKYRPVIGDDSTKTAIQAYELCSDLGIPKLVFWGANFYAEALAPSSGWIVWDKENGEGFFADGELAWTNDSKQLRIFRHQWKGMIRDSERGQKRVHPTQKPVALAEWCFENYGDPESVLDLFGGSGSTLIACEKTKRQCFMMELDPGYCDVIVSRWEQFTGQKAKLVKTKVINRGQADLR